MKHGIFFALVLIVNVCTGSAQSLYKDYKLKEANFIYQDSANGEKAIGDYEPTSLIGLNDGSFVVSTQFSISFPSQDKTPLKYDSTYFARSKVYMEKSHVSSGSIFKLNGRFEKEWEIVFRDKRVCKINLCSDSTIIAVAEKVEMDRFWIAKMDLSGKVIWEKEYRNNHEVSVADVVLDSLNNIYVLTESNRIIPVQLKRLEFGHKRLEFFKVAEMDDDLYLIKISPEGKKIWTATLDNRKNFETFGYRLIQAGDRIYASSSYDGFRKNIKYEGRNVFELNTKGRLLNRYETLHNSLLFFENGLISGTASGDGPVKVFRNVFKDSLELCSINAPAEINHSRFIKGINVIESKYLLGTCNYSQGYFLMKLNKDYLCKEYWIDEEYKECRPVDFTVLSDGSVVILGTKWIKVDNCFHNYTNLIKLSIN